MIAALLLAVVAPSTPRPPSLCTRDEMPLFVCPIRHKLVSVCGGRAGGAAVYRYGRPGHVEMTASGLRFSSHDFAGGGETQISFDNRGYTYVVYDRSTRTAFGSGGNDIGFTSGLVVRKGAKTISTGRCETDAAISDAIGRHIPAGRYIEH